MILTEHPDIIGFQEPRGEQRVNLVDDFNATYGVYSAVEDGVEEKYCGHVMIMYLNNRFTLLDKGAFWLSPTPDVPSKPEWNAIDKHYRMAIWVHLYDKLAKRDLYFCNTHLPYKAADNEARTACVQLITERLKKIAGDNAPLIVTGDMNASWSADDTRRNSIKGFFDWMGSARENAPVNLNPDTYSFNSFDASRARTTWNIDHIFYRNITPLEFNVVSSDKYGVKYVSDHYPITLSLTY
jgi:endonuclease/exonuclease/phosphatase family metal-dependent hydrolase